MKNTLLTCYQITKAYQEEKITTPVLRGVSFDLTTKDMLAIVGSSGSGKSTLLHILGALDRPNSGKVIISGMDVYQQSARIQAQLRNSKLGFIYQFHHLLMEFSALENVAMPLLIGGRSINYAKQQAQKLLVKVGLKHRLSHRPSELSGGERQRVAIARALVNNPCIVIADEPTGNLDSKNAQCIYNLLLEFNQNEGTAFIIATHDQMLANQLTRQLKMKNGLLLGLN